MSTPEIFQRTEMLLGESGLARLRKARVLLFGLGGVGSYAAEALARSGIGHFVLVDSDVVAPSNLNRQLIGTRETMGELKTDAEARRIASINPEAEVICVPVFYDRDTQENVPWDCLDYVVDAVDTVTAKLLIIERAAVLGVPCISSMGTGNKLDPSRLVVKDIYDTRVDPLARVMRRELRKRGIEKLQVVYSEEEPLRPIMPAEDRCGPKMPPGSTAFVPGAAGLLLASVVVRELAKCTAPFAEDAE